jgi:hypothetical protein
MVLQALELFRELFSGRIRPENAVRMHCAQLDPLLRSIARDVRTAASAGAALLPCCEVRVFVKTRCIIGGVT